jgi:hypothetical protein
MGVSKSLRLEVLQLCGTITSCVDLWSGWGLNQSCSPCPDLFNSVPHATCTQGNQVDSQLPMVESQIGSLTLDLSFGHNLCWKCPNGSCEPILNIYASIIFSNGIKNSSRRGVLDCAIDLWSFESPSGPQLPTMGIHLGVWVFISHTLLHSRVSFLARALASPCFGYKPNATVTTTIMFIPYVLIFIPICKLYKEMIKKYWKKTFKYKFRLGWTNQRGSTLKTKSKTKKTISIGPSYYVPCDLGGLTLGIIQVSHKLSRLKLRYIPSNKNQQMCD